MQRKRVVLTVVFCLLSFFISSSEAAKKSIRLDAEKFSKLQIPETYGLIDEIWLPTQTGGLQVPSKEIKEASSKEAGTVEKSKISPKLVIHIRDAHCIYEAQMNIAKIVEYLAKRYDIRLVCVEGYWGKFDPKNLLVEHTAQSVREKVFDDLMKQGEAVAVEYAMAVLNVPITVYGIEDEATYQKNLQAFRSVARNRERFQQIFKLFSHQLEDLEPHVYSHELKDFQMLTHQYEENKIPFGPYGVEVLKEYARRAGATDTQAFKEKYPNLTLFLEKETLEKNLDFKKVEEERTNFLTDVSSKISGAVLNEFLSKTLGYRLNRVSAADYYIYLEGLIQKNYSTELKDNTFKYPELLKFIAYEKIFGRIQNKALFKELDDVQDQVSQALAKTEEEKNLLRFSRSVKTLKRLYMSELNQDELAYYLAHKGEITLDGIISFLKTQSQKQGLRLRDGFLLIDEAQFSKLIPEAESFYTLASARNESLGKNLLDAMEKEKCDVVILIVGGFHTEAMKSLFKEKGIGYCVITPSIQEEVINNPYVRVMMGSKNPLDGLKNYFNKGEIPKERGGISK